MKCTKGSRSHRRGHLPTGERDSLRVFRGEYPSRDNGSYSCRSRGQVSSGRGSDRWTWTRRGSGDRENVRLVPSQEGLCPLRRIAASRPVVPPEGGPVTGGPRPAPAPTTRPVTVGPALRPFRFTRPVRTSRISSCCPNPKSLPGTPPHP